MFHTWILSLTQVKTNRLAILFKVDDILPCYICKSCPKYLYSTTNALWLSNDTSGGEKFENSFLKIGANFDRKRSTNVSKHGNSSMRIPFRFMLLGWLWTSPEKWHVLNFWNKFEESIVFLGASVCEPEFLKRWSSETKFWQKSSEKTGTVKTSLQALVTERIKIGLSHGIEIVFI